MPNRDLVLGTVPELSGPVPENWPLKFFRDRVKHESMLTTTCDSNRGIPAEILFGALFYSIYFRVFYRPEKMGF